MKLGRQTQTYKERTFYAEGFALHSIHNEDTDTTQGFNQGVTFKFTLATAWKLLERKKFRDLENNWDCVLQLSHLTTSTLCDPGHSDMRKINM